MKIAYVTMTILTLTATPPVTETHAARASQPKPDTVEKIQSLKPTLFDPASADAKSLQKALGNLLAIRRAEVNQRSSKEWHDLKDKAAWEKYRAEKLAALRASLGVWPDPPKKLDVRVTRTLEGDGYRLENVIYESRPGLWVSANLYSPAKPAASMPGILIIHSHHNPKREGELQDMGMNWARQGCLVLVPDQLGHGERRQHPFSDATKYDKPFKVGRQDYYFRYTVANQLHLIGDGLMGWMVWDMMRGVDLLLAKKGIDKNRIILLGAVAGGGDPAAVTAALDERITAAVPFNFGGPQPETKYPLPDDAEEKFNYLGGGSWESTRGLRLSGRDGFLPWVITGSLAPRGLIYGHEFAWDRDRDPVWKRLEKIYGWYGKRDQLSFATGKGGLTTPDSTHCNNIGPVHRRPIHETLKRWYEIPVATPEFQKRRAADELLCFTADALKQVKPLTVAALADQLADERLKSARAQRAKLDVDQKTTQLRTAWAKILGETAPEPKPNAEVLKGWTTYEGFSALPFIVEGEPGWSQKVNGTGKDVRAMAVPCGALLLSPNEGGKKPKPVVVAVAQHGRAAFLKQRAEVIAGLLKAGVAVCLVELRGTGEAYVAGDGRGRQSTSTGLSANQWLFGQTMLGDRLRDLRTVLAYLRGRSDIDSKRLALWGDSFAPENPAGTNLSVPLDAEKMPAQAEPLGGLLALLGALYEPDVKAVYVRGGLSGYQSLLKSQFHYVPHDALVPGVLTVGDLDDVAAALAPRALRLEALVDGHNQRVAAADLEKAYALTRAAFKDAKAATRLTLAPEPAEPARVAEWLAEELKK